MIALVNSWMIPLVRLFRAVEGNGLSPFAGVINSKNELLALINPSFCPPERDMMRGTSSLVEDNEDKVNMDLYGDGEGEDEEGGEEDDKETFEPVDNADDGKAEVVSHHVREIR